MKKKREVMKAFLAEDTEFEGKLTFSGSVRIDGRFKGEISASEGALLIGERGLVEADIKVTDLVICGEVRGNVEAENRIEIQAPAKVFGDIQARSISVDEGAVFEGNCQMKNTGKVALLTESAGSKNGSEDKKKF